MKVKITFQNMSSSPAMEELIHKKLERLEHLISHEASPKFIEFWLKADPPHHRVEGHLKTQHYNINCHDSGPDIYAVCDHVITKIIARTRKEKEKRASREHAQQSVRSTEVE